MTAPSTPLPRRQFLGGTLAALAGALWFGRAGRAEPVEAAVQGDFPYVSEIRMFAGTFAPAGWSFCEGQLLAINQYEALFSLIGTAYGGDGQETFALPDLRGRAPVHMEAVRPLGTPGGQEDVFLPLTQIPSHSHAAGASSANASSDDPTGRVPARDASGAPHYGPTADTNLASGALLSTGGTTPHNNMQPYLCIHYIICLEGIYPIP